jgi:hypothetical protein
MASIKTELAPFQTPNFVRLKPIGPGRGSENTPCIPLRDVPTDVLMQMCKDFTDEVMRKHRTPEKDTPAPRSHP